MSISEGLLNTYTNGSSLHIEVRLNIGTIITLLTIFPLSVVSPLFLVYITTQLLPAVIPESPGMNSVGSKCPAGCKTGPIAR